MKVCSKCLREICCQCFVEESKRLKTELRENNGKCVKQYATYEKEIIRLKKSGRKLSDLNAELLKINYEIKLILNGVSGVKAHSQP